MFLLGCISSYIINDWENSKKNGSRMTKKCHLSLKSWRTILTLKEKIISRTCTAFFAYHQRCWFMEEDNRRHRVFDSPYLRSVRRSQHRRQTLAPAGSFLRIKPTAAPFPSSERPRATPSSSSPPRRSFFPNFFLTPFPSHNSHSRMAEQREDVRSLAPCGRRDNAVCPLSTFFRIG